MNPTVAAFLRSWPFAPWTITGCVLTALVYARGWRALTRRRASHWSGRELAAFLAGLSALALAVSSPLEPFAGLLLSAHMVQHALLMFVAPPLLLLAKPQLPLMQGLPREVLALWLLPVLRATSMRHFWHRLTHPVTAWLAATIMLCVWHLPTMYELALDSEVWHFIEHLSFFGSALLFWWPVVQPWPSRAVWPRAAMLPYLFLAMLLGTVLCAFLAFSDRVIYPRYTLVPRVAGVSALVDQAVAGALMWVLGIAVNLIPLSYIAARLLYPERRSPHAEATRERPSLELRTREIATGWPKLALAAPGIADSLPAVSFAPLPVVERPMTRQSAPQYALTALRPMNHPHSSASLVERTVVTTRTAPARIVPRAIDLLRLPLVGTVLRWPYTRRALQVVLLALAAAIVLDGLAGPQLAPLNLAGVLPWVHWRGMVVLTLLLAGNFFCMACPLMLPRAIGRRLVSPRWEWPRALRSKWLAVGLLLLFFWSYEALDLWLSPWWTAWIIVGYFVVAFAIDMLFQGAAFCKYVCPVGQFQFVQSLVSPWQVQVRDASVCATCRTKECMRGGENVRGCEMHLILPRKADNLDCTFCLDCVHACPAANIGILVNAPRSAGNPTSHTIGLDASRVPSGQRADVAVLILLLVFAAFASAAGMIAPVVAGEEWCARALDCSTLAVETIYLIISLVLLPILAISMVGVFANWFSESAESTTHVVSQYAPAIAPIGAAMWLAHYGFHLAVGATSFIPAGARFLGDWGWHIAISATLSRRCCAIEPPSWLLTSEILCLDVGLLLSLYLAFQISTGTTKNSRSAWRAFLPWGALIVILFATGVWILHQPMEMRGTLPAELAAQGMSP